MTSKITKIVNPNQIKNAVTTMEIKDKAVSAEEPFNPELKMMNSDVKQFQKEQENLAVKKQSLYLNFINELANKQNNILNSKRLFQSYREQFTLLQAKFL